ncbi:MAG TPA: DUF58 domain-containing protein [Candidatus Eremiobacteraeota bacterium]|nr:MAG: hypothetical protein BWY64_02584 [bacterium ADurb.Bin363]HPZ09318.1 DUF58 domain-containing protein [Candidatus Eremiobacteraeota bacterium]
MNLLEPEFIKKLEYLSILSRKVFKGSLKGEHKSKKKGISPEFSDYRNYTIGDDLRYIDWNLYGRLEKLFLKLFLEEEDLYVYLLLDTSASMDWGDPKKLDYSIKVIAALGYIALNNMDRVSLMRFDSNMYCEINSVRGKGQFLNLVQNLQSIKGKDSTNLNEALKRFALRISKPGLVIIISDFLDEKGFEQGLKFLLYRKFEPFLIQVLAPQELNPEINGNIKLIDIETNLTKELTLNQTLIAFYKKNLNNYIDRLHNFCNEKGYQHIISSTSLPFDNLILNTLRRGELIR